MSSHPAANPAGPRLLIVDLARTLALIGMVVFHFTYDLDMFGWVPRGTAVSGWFWYHARIVAGSFIFLAGLGLWMAHGRGIRWPGFWRRFAKIVAAAAVVTLVSHFAMPGMTIFYGILHAIAVSSLVGLAFLLLPAGVNLALAAGVFWLPYVYVNPSLGGVWIWTGLSGIIPQAADFEPFFPWFAPFLAGIALGQILSCLDLWRHLALPEYPALRALSWPGRHSLAIYLIHQPVLIALIGGVTMILRG